MRLALTKIALLFFLTAIASSCTTDQTPTVDHAEKTNAPATVAIDNAVIAEIFPNDGLSNDTCGLPDFSEQVIRKVNEIRAQARYCGANS